MITNCGQIQNAFSLNVKNLSISSIDGIQYFIGLDSLNCRDNQLISLPSLPSSLISLFCDKNQLSSLPTLPSSLSTLSCNENQLSSLPALPAWLDQLWCSGNPLDSLPALPATIRIMYCSDCNLLSLPALPASLTKLVCNSNQLQSLPQLPANLNHIDCGFNQLNNLPTLPLALGDLDCISNQLTSLPNLPSSLLILNCSNNQLTSLPALPTSLLYLNANLNQLSSLPILPPSLTQLHCGLNQLSSLPSLPPSIQTISCFSNQLTSMPKIPGNTRNLYCFNNPLTCFPEIAPRLSGTGSSFWQNINIDSTLISCIPNLGTFPLSVVHSSQPLPICSPVNQGCKYNYTCGYVYFDANGNGNKDSFEQHGFEFPVYFSGNSGIYPNISGLFYTASDTGNISFQVVLPKYYVATTPLIQTIHVVNGIVDTLYFGVQPVPNINDLKIDLSSIGFLRPGYKAIYQLHYQNIGTDTLFNVRVKFLKPSQLVNLSALATPSLFSGDTLIWNISFLKPFQEGDAVITDSIFANAVLGGLAPAFAWIEPIVGDTTPVDNVVQSGNVIRGSCDPNDKAVSPQLVLPNSNNNFEYFIRFQNTGTDTAFTVIIMDTLSTLLDIYSMQMISASHSYELSIANRIAKWTFNNILLPDSNTNELESHGFVKFRIKPLPGLTVTDSIQNKADIYFDYNTAVTTNTIVVNVLNPLQVKDLQDMELQVYPNPVQESLRIVNQHAGPLGKIELINASGKVLETKTISSSSYTWNLQDLPAGTYILKGQGWGQKVVKE